MYVFGGWIPVPEMDKNNSIGAEWICTNTLSILNLGQYFFQVSDSFIRVFTQAETQKSIFIGFIWAKCGAESF